MFSTHVSHHGWSRLARAAAAAVSVAGEEGCQGWGVRGRGEREGKSHELEGQAANFGITTRQQKTLVTEIIFSR